MSPGEGNALLPTSILAHPEMWHWPPRETSLRMAGKQAVALQAPELVETVVMSVQTWAAQGNKGMEKGQQPGSDSCSLVVASHPRALPSTTVALDHSPL